MNVIERIQMLKKMVKEAERIVAWQETIYTALHNIHADWVVSGVFPVGRGGTGLSTIALGGILYASVLDVLSRLAPTAANQVLRSTAANALQFATLLAADIPNLDASKITSGAFALARIPNIDWGRISANFPRTIADLLSDHNLAHHALGTIVPHDALASLTERAHSSLTGVTSSQHHAKAHTLASHSTKAHSELTGVNPSDHHAKTLLDDTPVDGETAKGITSNWAYDHNAVANPTGAHGTVAGKPILCTDDIHDTPVDGATAAAISSNWAYDHDLKTTGVHGVGAGAIVGTTLSQTLTNKTLTSPTINGTIATTGLTMPAFTVNGDILSGGLYDLGSNANEFINTHTRRLVLEAAGVITTVSGGMGLLQANGTNVAAIGGIPGTHFEILKGKLTGALEGNGKDVGTAGSKVYSLYATQIYVDRLAKSIEGNGWSLGVTTPLGVVYANYYYVGATAGCDFDGVVTNITVVKGIVTAVS